MGIMDLSINQEAMGVQSRFGNQVFKLSKFDETDAKENNNLYNSRKTDTDSDSGSLFRDGYSSEKLQVDPSLFSYSSFKKAMDLRTHNRMDDENRRTIFEDADYFAKNFFYKLLPITFEQVDETIIHTEHNYSLFSLNSESEAEEDCSRTMIYSQIKEKNYKRRRTKFKDGSDEEMWGTPEPRIKNFGKIPRWRPKTATSSNHSGPKIDDTKLTKILPDKCPTKKSNLSLPPKKDETDGESVATEILTVKDDEHNSSYRGCDGLQESNPSAWSSNTKSSNLEMESNLNEASLGLGNCSQKSKDIRRKRTETLKTSSDANQPVNLSKKSSQDSQKLTQVLKKKLHINELVRKRSINEKIKEALKEDFSAILPIYQKEMKKITDVWVNSIYGSLTMRSHLVKLLVDAFPNINMGQFQTEDDRLLKCIAQAKAYTETETENLIQFIKSLLKSQASVKEESENVIEEKEIANSYSNDWSLMTKKIAELAEETRKLQMAIPEEEKKKGVYEKKMREKIRETEAALNKKEEEIKKLVHQLTTLKQKELNFRGTIAMKLEDFNEIKADIESLKTIEEEYHDLKSTYLEQNETYKKKIEALESLLEEKKKTLEKEKEMKRHMQEILEQLQAQQQRLRSSIGSEQVDYIMGQTLFSREKSREQLWIAAVKLVLRGYLAQMKKLEYDKNKMLLELQSHDMENFKNAAATLVRKEHFIKSILSQMMDFQKSCKYLSTENENSFV